MTPDAEVAVVGAGVVGCATALALARRGASVALLEAEPEPGLAASGTNSGILHTGFDSRPGELETDLILAAGALRDRVLAGLEIPVLRCGAVMRPRDESDRRRIAGLAENARRNRVAAQMLPDASLEIPGEAVTDPVRYTLALAHAAVASGAEQRMGWRVDRISSGGDGELTIGNERGESMRCRVAVNCGGLHADAVARLAGDDSFSIDPRKGEFLVFEPATGERLERILLPVPSKRTKGMLVFPTLDGKVVAGPTAIDLVDKRDWSVRPEARDEILPKAWAMYPPLEGAREIAAYAGLRPAGRDGRNYVIGVSGACPRLINVAAIRSTGLTASLGIAAHVAALLGSLGVTLSPERPLPAAAAGGGPGSAGPAGLGGAGGTPWWRRSASHYAR